MTCPTCSSPMQRLGGELGIAWFWCPRCGTVKSRVTDEDEIEQSAGEAPALVRRCRQLVASSPPWYRTDLHRYGIIEACLLPHERPPTP